MARRKKIGRKGNYQTQCNRRRLCKQYGKQIGYVSPRSSGMGRNTNGGRASAESSSMNTHAYHEGRKAILRGIDPRTGKMLPVGADGMEFLP